MAETTAFQVADNILSSAAEYGDPITNLKLQKLLYYAQAWHLALHDKPLFDERIEAWVHGPAVPPVYGAFKAMGWQPIVPPPIIVDVSDAVKSHVREVLEAYGGLSAYQLELLTHQEYPWQNARRGLAPDEPSNNIISQDDMKAFYRAVMNAEENKAR